VVEAPQPSMPILLLLFLAAATADNTYTRNPRKRDAEPQFGFGGFGGSGGFLGGMVKKIGDVADRPFESIGFLGSKNDFSKTSANHAIIFLHGLGPKIQGPLCKMMAGPMLGLKNCEVRCPLARSQSVGILPPTMIPGFNAATGGQIRSWFNFWLMPIMSIVAPNGGESKEQLDEALKIVDREIEDLHNNNGIPLENIVLSGASQGGVMTLYYALHGRYKLGGMIPIVTWLPLLQPEPPSSLKRPVNWNTPILHLNGIMDPIVPVPCAIATKRAMEPVFTNYQLKLAIGTHVSTMGPHNIPFVKCWMKENTNIKFRFTLPCSLAGLTIG